MIPRVTITCISVERVFDNLGNFNSNNHTLLELCGREPLADGDEYESIMRQTAFHQWVHLTGLDFCQVKLFLDDCVLLIEAGTPGQLTNRVPNQYREELEELGKRLDNEMKIIPCFARFSRCSLKDGKNGPGPFTNAMDMLSNIVTSGRCYEELSRNVRLGTMPVMLYTLPWLKEMNVKNEFRVFVYDGQVTAISQYDAYVYAGWDMRQSEIMDLVIQVEKMVESYVNSNLKTTSFTMDILFNNTSVTLVELNSFGAQMAAGSALFHWIIDYDLLHGKLDGIEVRVLSFMVFTDCK